MATVEEVIKGIDQLRKELADIRFQSDESLRWAKLRTWTTRAYEQLRHWRFPTEAEQDFGRSSEIAILGFDRRAKLRDDVLKALRDDVASHPEHYESKLTSTEQSEPVSAEPVPVQRWRLIPMKAHKIFLGHGRNRLWARAHMHLKDELHLDVEAWESESRAGMHTVEILRRVLASCRFAVIVATAEDTTAEGEVRARQNVVHEIGLFQGRIGFEKVALLEQEGIEGFSNLAGLQVIPFPGERIEAAFYELDRMLKREGVIR